MISDGLPSDDELRQQFDGASSGKWVCWVYPVEGSDRMVKVWNRTLDRMPLASRFKPVGCIEMDLG